MEMSEFILCSGEKAEHPYLIMKRELPVYTMEELCFFLHEYLFFLNEEFFCPELYSWIRNELKLPGLASSLINLSNRGGSPYEAAMMIFDFSGIYSLQEMNAIRSTIHDLENRTDLEKLKYRADFLLATDRFREALYLYLRLLQSKNTSRMTEGMRKEILFNTGVIYGRCFLYGEAADYFRRAYQLEPDDKAAACYYRARFLAAPDQDLKQDPEVPLEDRQLKTICGELRTAAETKHPAEIKSLESWFETYEQLIR
ncbi:MAG TPA: hypothetical protein DCF42_03465 [Lachnospiraceae bacterium]|nr:hypothetical protein [Lachnospiraceae bacterium]